MTHACEKLAGNNVVDSEGDVKPETDYRVDGEWLEVPERSMDRIIEPESATATESDDEEDGGYDAYGDLGGRVVELTAAQEDAMYNAGLGSPAMRLAVERRRQALIDEVQRRINAAGVAAVRQAAKEADAKAGKDTESNDYLAHVRHHDDEHPLQ